MKQVSANAWITPVPISAGKVALFGKVANVKSGDSILDDGLNSVAMQSLAKRRMSDHPNERSMSKWTLNLLNANSCDVKLDVQAFRINPGAHRHCVLEYVAIRGVTRLSLAEMGSVLCTFFQSFITESRRSGLMHNDMHLHNVMFDGSRLILIDYGRVVFTRNNPEVDPRLPLAAKLLNMGGTPPRVDFEKQWYLPFSTLKELQQMHEWTWVPDVMMYSCQLYMSMLQKQPSAAVPFLKTRGAHHLPNFTNGDDLLRKAMAVQPSLRPLLPGLCFMAITGMLAQSSGIAFDSAFYPNYSLTRRGGRLLSLFISGARYQPFATAIAFCTDSAGLDVGLFPIQVGGGIVPELPIVDEESMPSYGTDLAADVVLDLPESLAEAAEAAALHRQDKPAQLPTLDELDDIVIGQLEMADDNNDANP
jgi:hypothetical protein